VSIPNKKSRDETNGDHKKRQAEKPHQQELCFSFKVALHRSPFPGDPVRTMAIKRIILQMVPGAICCVAWRVQPRALVPSREIMIEHNPYAPTKGALSVTSLDEPIATIEVAPRWRRLANLLIDLTVYVFLSMLIGVVNVAVSLSFGVDLIGAAGQLVSLGILFMYYFLSEALLGKTVGKLVTRTRVVAESGARAQHWQIFVRTLYRLVPLEAISFLGRRRYGWHDRWSKTRVIIVQRGQG
jgi:uncharacterized RDD family membrane protein YckC